MNLPLGSLLVLVFCILQNQLGKACQPGSHGPDCDIWPTRLFLDYEQSAYPYGNWMYFYFPASSFQFSKDSKSANFDDLALYITKPAGVPASISITFQDYQDDDLPTSESLESLDSWTEVSEIRIQSGLFQQNKGRIMMIGIYSEQIDFITIASAYTDAEEPTTDYLYLVLIPIAIFGIILFATGVYCYKRRFRLHEEEIRRRHISQRVSQPPKSNFNEIQDLFVKSKYSSLKSQFDQQSCCICLDKYDHKSVCIQLYCQHIFHSQCIESWLQQHTTCPDCRKLMTADAIKQYYEEEKGKYKENKKECEDGNREEIPLAEANPSPMERKIPKEDCQDEVDLERGFGLSGQTVEINFLNEIR